MKINAVICDIKHFSVQDGPGIRTTVFFKGCPLHCLWCHNPESIAPKPELGIFHDKCKLCGNCALVCSCHKIINGTHEFDRKNCTACGKCSEICLYGALELYGREISLEDAVNAVLEDRDFYEESGGGVTVSGGEPLLQVDFNVEFLSALKKENINTAVDTCGQIPWSSFEKIIPFADMFLFDFKHVDSAKHKELTGCGNELITNNLIKLSESGKAIEIRMPLIPSLNCSDEDIHAAGAFLKDIRNIKVLKLLSYHAFASSKYKAIDRNNTLVDIKSPDSKFLEGLAEILRDYDLNVIF